MNFNFKNIIIIALIATNIFTFFILIKPLNNENNSIKEINLLKDSIEFIKMHYIFDKLQIGVSSENDYVLQGDTFTFNTFIKANNISNIFYEKKPYIVIAKECKNCDSFDISLENIIDTLTADNWEREVKIKTQEKGLKTIYGKFFLPIGSDYSYKGFPFRKTFVILDKNENDRIKSILKN